MREFEIIYLNFDCEFGTVEQQIFMTIKRKF